jgi:hypothetical protein
VSDHRGRLDHGKVFPKRYIGIVLACI